MGLWISWKWFAMINIFVRIKTSYYFFKQKLLQKAKEKDDNAGGETNLLKLFITNKEVLK